MSDVVINDVYLTDIANAIRDRNGSQETYKPHKMDEAIKDIHNVKIKKWIRPTGWADYSKLDISNEEAIYLTYDTTYGENISFISIRVYGDYTVVRGSVTNYGFVPLSNSTNISSGLIFQEDLPTNAGDYVVYKITPQSGSHITRFAFARKDNSKSSQYYRAWEQPCVERYCRIPYWVGTASKTGDQYVWSTRNLVADTIMDSTEILSLYNAYNDGGFVLRYINMSTCSFAKLTNLSNAFYGQSNLDEVYLPHDLGTACTNVGSAFYNNNSLI